VGVPGVSVGVTGTAAVTVAVTGMVSGAAVVEVGGVVTPVVEVGPTWAFIEAGAGGGEHAARAKGNARRNAQSPARNHTGRVPRALLLFNI
jgi:hypothetical protein